MLFIGLNRSGSGHDLWPLVIAQLTGLMAVGLIAAVSRDLKPPPPRAGWLASWPASPAGRYPPATSSRHTGPARRHGCHHVATPGSTILLARVLLGERLTRTRLAGLGLAAASVALIAVGGPAERSATVQPPDPLAGQAPPASVETCRRGHPSSCGQLVRRRVERSLEPASVAIPIIGELATTLVAGCRP